MTSEAVANQSVTVVGGTYRELCAEPTINSLYGSGVRAAGVLASLGRSVRLYTCVDEHSKSELDAVQASLGVSETITSPRPEAVTFSYATPVSPAAWSAPAAAAPIDIAADVLLAFGMVEASWTVRGGRIVIDPQHGDLLSMLDAAQGDSVAVVLNAHEAERVTGRSAIDAGPLIQDMGANVVVIKRGALGGLVFSTAGVETFTAIPTQTVRPIGSGDAFTAGFTHAWAQDPAVPADAARFGAQVAAVHSLTGLPQVSRETLALLPDALPNLGDATPQVYLAAPFFTLPQRLLLDLVRNALRDLGSAVFSPLHDVGQGGDEVAASDLAGLRSSHAVIALLDGADPGTVFEAGWATSEAIPVIGFSAHPTAHDWTMLRGSGADVTSDLATAVYRAVWAAISALDSRGRT